MPKYVNADKLIARMREIADEKWNKRAAPVCWSDAYGNFIDELEEADAEDVAPVKHGRWRFCGCDSYNDCYECSYCGKMAMNDTAYCPSCGAKMDDEEG